MSINIFSATVKRDVLFLNFLAKTKTQVLCLSNSDLDNETIHTIHFLDSTIERKYIKK